MVPAYSLTLKCWGLINVDNVENIKWKDDIYDMLQMEAEQKEMVRGIIESHHASSSSFDDFIPGKDKGLVFRLHGPPGCGKTLTAGAFPIQHHCTTLTPSRKCRRSSPPPPLLHKRGRARAPRNYKLPQRLYRGPARAYFQAHRPLGSHPALRRGRVIRRIA